MQTLEQLEQRLLDLKDSLKDQNSKVAFSQRSANNHERLMRYLRDPATIGLLNQNIISWRTDCENKKNERAEIEQQIKDIKEKIDHIKDNQNISAQSHTERLRM